MYNYHAKLSPICYTGILSGLLVWKVNILKRIDALKFALTLGLLATSEQVLADNIQLNINTMGNGSIPITISADDTVDAIKNAIYNELLTQNASAAVPFYPENDKPFLYYDSGSTVSLLESTDTIPTTPPNNAFILSSQELTPSGHLNNQSATNLLFSYINTTGYGSALYIATNNSITIDNTAFVKNSTPYLGGAIYNAGEIINGINSSIFLGNSASHGAAIYNVGTIDDINNTQFTSNTVTTSGGAIYNTGKIGTVSGSTFTNNQTPNSSGGVITNTAGAKIDEISTSVFKDNTASTYGGVIVNSGTITDIKNNEFFNNKSGNWGGVILNNIDAEIGTIYQTIFTNNYAVNTEGGAIYNRAEITTIDSSIFSGNGVNTNLTTPETTTKSGGAIYNTKKIGSIIDTEFKNNSAQETAGAVYNSGEITKILRGTFTGNTTKTAFGGAIVNAGGTIGQILNSEFKENNSATYGGVIYNTNKITDILDTTFTGNTAYNSGGAIYNLGDIDNILRTTFSKNITTSGGGAALSHSTGTILQITDSKFEENQSNSYAGGIVNGGTINLIKNTDFTKNSSADWGAAIFNNNGAYIGTIQEAEFTGNYAFNTEGGAIYNEGTIKEIINSYFTSNGLKDYDSANPTASTTYGGAIYNSGKITNGISDSFFTGNVAGTGGAISSSSAFSIDNVEFKNNEARKLHGGALYGTYKNITNSLFQDNLSYSGGGAALINAELIDNVKFISNNAATKEGLTEYLYHGGGALNTQGTLGTIKNSIFELNTALGHGGALNVWNNNSGTIQLDSVIDTSFENNTSLSGWGGAISNTSDINEIKKSTTPDGTAKTATFASNSAVIGGAISNASRNNSGNYLNPTINLIDGYTFDKNSAISSNTAFIKTSDGYFSSASRGYSEGLGGAIYNEGTINTIQNAIFTNNSSSNKGGAIYNSGTINKILNSEFTANKSQYGAAIYNTGTIYLENTNFQNNIATYAGGGAIYNASAAKLYILANTADTIFSGNIANSISNAIHNTGAIYLNGDTGKSIIFDDAITGLNGRININQYITGIKTASTILFNNSVTGNIVNLHNGLLSLGKDGNYAPNIETLNVLGGTLDISNNKIDTININELSNTAKLTFDIDFADTINNYSASDKLNIQTGNGIFNINADSVNILSDLTVGKTKITLANEHISTTDFWANTSKYKYWFNPENTGDITIYKALINGLKENLNNDSVETYNLLENEYIVENLGSSGTDNFEINGNGYGITTHLEKSGIILNANNTLTLADIGKLNADKTILNSVNGFVSQNGGFIKNSGSLAIDNVIFSNNKALAGGGAIFSDSSITNISNSIFDTNIATGYGGAIYNAGTIDNINDTIFANNSSSGGGAIRNSGKITIYDSNFSNNISTANGGAIYNSSDLIINKNNTNVTFNENEAKSGGAIYNDGSNLSISNANFTKNTASQFGGALYNANSGIITQIINSEFTQNEATTSGSAIYNLGKINNIENTVFDSNETNAGVIFNSENSIITKIKDGEFSNNISLAAGGAIYNAGTINITGTNFSNNESTAGSAIRNASTGTIELIDASFNNNTTTGFGGAIYNSGKLEISHQITGVSFEGNEAGSGGAIYNDGQELSINNASFTTNTATSYGGALFNKENSTISEIITNSFTSNSTTNFGGAIANLGNITLIQDSNFSNNTASNKLGGAIYNVGTINNINSTELSTTAIFSNNNAAYGGAIYNENAITLDNVAFLNNIATTSGGAIFNNTSGTINIFLKSGDSVFSGNLANGNSNAIHNNGVININGNNGNSVTFDDEISGSNGKIYINSQIAGINSDSSVIFNKDVTGNEVSLYAGTLSLGSDGSYAPNIDNLKILGGTLDIANGKIENITLNELSNNPDLMFDIDFGEQANGLSLSDTIEIATGGSFDISDNNINVIRDLDALKTTIKLSDDTITTNSFIGKSSNYKYLFSASNLDGTIDVLKAKLFGLKEAVNASTPETRLYTMVENEGIIEDLGVMGGTKLTITGNGFGIIGNGYSGIQASTPDSILELNNIGSVVAGNIVNAITGFNVALFNEAATFNIDSSVFSGNKTAIINNAKIENIANSLFSQNETINNGAAIINSGLIKSIDATDFISNCANNGNGGAISNSIGSTIETIKNATFSTNNAATGGAIYNSGIILLNNVTFNDNTASANAGAIYNEGTITLDGVTFDGNTATTNGGAIYNTGTLTITDTSFLSNNATNNGGAIYTSNDIDIIADAQNVIFENNTANGIANDIFVENNSTINLNANADKSITLNAGIKTTINNIINLNINDSNISSHNEGSIIFKTALNDTVANVNAGKIILDGNNVSNVEINLTTNNAILEIGEQATLNIEDFNNTTNIISNGNINNFGRINIDDNDILDAGVNFTNNSSGIIDISGGKLIVNSGDSLSVGTVNISGGQVAIQTGGQISSLYTQTNGNTLLSGGELNLTTGSALQSGSLDISSGQLSLSGSSSISDVVSVNMSGGKITINENAFVTFDAADTLNGDITLNNGTLKLGKDNTASPNVAQLNIKGGILDIQNNLTSTIAIATWENIPQLNFDVDLANSDSNGFLASDYITGLVANTDINLGNINILSDMTNDYGSIKLADNHINISDKIIHKGDFLYLFKAEANNNGIIEVIKGISNGLMHAIQQDGIRDYYLTKNENILQNLGAMAGDSLAINGSSDNWGLIGNNYAGISLTTNQNLSVQNVGKTDLSSSITKFKSENGGFINNQGGTINIENSVLASNNATNNGGAILNNGSATISSSILANNTAAQGGAIYNSSYAQITNSQFTNNSSSINGGAIYNQGTIALNNSVFDNNSSSGKGGAIYNEANATIQDTSFTNNSAATGGAIFNDGNLTIVAENQNIEFSSNNASSDNNAIFNQNELNFKISNGSTISMEDKIDGLNGQINIDAQDGKFILNNSVKNNNINLTTGEIVLSANGVISEEILLNTAVGTKTTINGGILDINLSGPNQDIIKGQTILNNGKLNLLSNNTENTFNNLVANGGEISLIGSGTTIFGNNTTIAKEVNLVLSSDSAIKVNSSELNIDENDNWNGQKIELENNSTLGLATGKEHTISQSNEIKVNDGNVLLTNNTKLVYDNSLNENGDKYSAQSGNFILGDDSSSGTIKFGNETNNTTTIVMENENSSVDVKNNTELVLVNSSTKNTSLSKGDLSIGDNANIELQGGSLNKDVQVTIGNNSKLTITGAEAEIDSSDSLGEGTQINLTSGKLVFNNVNKNFEDAGLNISNGNFVLQNNSEIITKNPNSLAGRIDLEVLNSKLNYLEGAMNVKNITNAGLIDTINGVLENHQISENLVIGSSDNKIANFNIDINPLGGSDTYNAQNIISGTGGEAIAHISDFKLTSDPKDTKTTYQIFNGNIDSNVKFTATDKIIQSKIGDYILTPDSKAGSYTFERIGFKPSAQATAVAAQLGGYLNQLNIYDYSFSKLNNFMMLPKEKRAQLLLDNKYAFNSADEPLYANENDKNSAQFATSNFDNSKNDIDVWYKGYTTFEKVDLGNNTKVNNTMYGGLIGIDSKLYDLPKGWSGMISALGGYTGSNQRYSGIKNYQNGASTAISASAYKGNFFTGLTLANGISLVESNTNYGDDEFIMMMTGVASKSGYNFDLFSGHLIIQPTYLMSYTMVKAFDHTTSAGGNVHSDPLHAIQIQPGLNLIGNLKYGWQPYLGFNMVWNLLDKTKYTINDVSLPQLSVDPYAEYNIGFNKIIGERCSGFFQTTLRSGGRKGISLQGGITFKF